MPLQKARPPAQGDARQAIEGRALPNPFAARLLAHGALNLITGGAGAPAFPKCWLAADPPISPAPGGRIGIKSFKLPELGQSSDAVALVGAADVPPGTYDVAVACEGATAAGAAFLDLQVTVQAVPR